MIAAFTSLSFDGTDRAGISPRADASTRAVCAVLFRGTPPRDAVQALLARATRGRKPKPSYSEERNTKTATVTATPDANTKTCPDSNANANPTYAPTALIHSLKHYKVLHERNVILTIDYAPLPPVDPAERVQITPMSERFSRIRLRFGFMERPNVPRALAAARRLGWQFDIMSTSFFLSRRALRLFRHAALAG